MCVFCWCHSRIEPCLHSIYRTPFTPFHSSTLLTPVHPFTPLYPPSFPCRPSWIPTLQVHQLLRGHGLLDDDATRRKRARDAVVRTRLVALYQQTRGSDDQLAAIAALMPELTGGPRQVAKLLRKHGLVDFPGGRSRRRGVDSTDDMEGAAGRRDRGGGAESEERAEGGSSGGLGRGGTAGGGGERNGGFTQLFSPTSYHLSSTPPTYGFPVHFHVYTVRLPRPY